MNGFFTQSDASLNAAVRIDLNQINQSAASSGQIVKFNGAEWVPANNSGGGSTFDIFNVFTFTGTGGTTTLAAGQVATVPADGVVPTNGWYIVKGVLDIVKQNADPAVARVRLRQGAGGQAFVSDFYMGPVNDYIFSVNSQPMLLTSGDIMQFSVTNQAGTNSFDVVANGVTTFTLYRCF